MGSKTTKPTSLKAGEVNCKSDQGFKLIQINLDANENGDGISIATIFFIMVMTVFGLYLLRKLYGMFIAFRAKRQATKIRNRHYQEAPIIVNQDRQGLNERIPRVENPV